MWIDANKELPEDGTPVLISFISARNEYARCYGLAVFWRGTWYWWEGSLLDVSERVTRPITHWQSLPPLPEYFQGIVMQ